MEFASLQILIIGATAAILIPVLIHLFNRTRFQVTDWAAMEFLLAALKKTKRRVRLENLLLLLLRILVLLFLALMLARPSIEGETSIEKKTHNVIVLDDSWSMATSYGQETAFDRATRQIRDWVHNDSADDTGAGFTLIPTSARMRDFNIAEEEDAGDPDAAPAQTGDKQLDDANQAVAEVEKAIIEQEAGINRAIRDGEDPAKAREKLQELRDELVEAKDAVTNRMAELTQRADDLRGQIETARNELETNPESGDAQSRLDRATADLEELQKILPLLSGPVSRDSDTEDVEAANRSELYTDSRDWIINRLGDVRPGLRPAADWQETLAIVKAALNESGDHFEAKRVFIFSDMQALNFPQEADASIGGWRALMKEIGELADDGIHFVNVGQPCVNRTIVEASLAHAVVGVGVKQELRLVLRNNTHGTVDDSASEFHVRYRTDGGIFKTLLRTTVDPGKEVQLAPELPGFRTVGSHTIELALEEGKDANTIDNRWFLSVDVRDAIDVLAVNGAPGKFDGFNDVEDEIFFFMVGVPTISRELAHMSPEELRNNPDYIPKTVVNARDTTVKDLDGINFFDYDVVLLANVQSLEPAHVKALERYVRAGNSVIFTLGDNIDEKHYVDVLWNKGKGLFPMRLLHRTQGEPVRTIEKLGGASLVPVQPYHRAIRSLAEEDETIGTAHLKDPAIFRFFQFDWSTAPADLRRIVDIAADPIVGSGTGNGSGSQPDDGSDEEGSDGSDEGTIDEEGDALPSARDAAGVPSLLMSHAYGRGQVVVFTSSLDARWEGIDLANNMVRYPSFIPFWQEMVYALAEVSHDHKSLTVGDPYRRPISPLEFSQNNFIFPPGRHANDPRNGIPVTVRNRVRAERENTFRGELFYDDTDAAGVYTVRIFKQRDPLQQLIRHLLEKEGGVEPVRRRTVAERIADAILNLEAEADYQQRREAVRQVLALPESGDIVDEKIGQLATRISIDVESLLNGAEHKNILDHFVVNPDMAEGQLQPVGTGKDGIQKALERLFPGVKFAVHATATAGSSETDATGDSVLAKKKSNIWKFVAWTLLVLLGLEMFVALLFTHRQR